jgi:hypothetical protein
MTDEKHGGSVNDGRLTMSAMIRTRLGACAVLLASLVAVSGPAAAKITIECKKQLRVTEGPLPTEWQAKSYAQTKWMQTVKSKYGVPWMDFSKATAIHYQCKQIQGGWACTLWARPCSQVTPPSPSAATP